MYKSGDSFIIYTGEQSHVKILLSSTVAVVVFVAVDFGCLYGYCERETLLTGRSFNPTSRQKILDAL